MFSEHTWILTAISAVVAAAIAVLQYLTGNFE